MESRDPDLAVRLAETQEQLCLIRGPESGPDLTSQDLDRRAQAAMNSMNFDGEAERKSGTVVGQPGQTFETTPSQPSRPCALRTNRRN